MLAQGFGRCGQSDSCTRYPGPWNRGTLRAALGGKRQKSFCIWFTFLFFSYCGIFQNLDRKKRPLVIYIHNWPYEALIWFISIGFFHKFTSNTGTWTWTKIQNARHFECRSWFCGGVLPMKKSLGMYLSCFFWRVILLMEEILHHLGYIKPCKQDKLPINWCRVASISTGGLPGEGYWEPQHFLSRSSGRGGKHGNKNTAKISRVSCMCPGNQHQNLQKSPNWKGIHLPGLHFLRVPY